MHLHAHVMELSYDVHGCRVIQCILEHGTDLIRTNVFNQIEPNLLAVIQHRCGNYVIQSAIRKWYSNLFANLSLNSLICLILYRVLSTTLATTFDWLRFGGHNLFVQSQVFIECGRKVHWFGDCSTKTASNGLDLFTWRTVSFVIWVKRRLMFHFILFFFSLLLFSGGWDDSVLVSSQITWSRNWSKPSTSDKCIYFTPNSNRISTQCNVMCADATLSTVWRDDCKKWKTRSQCSSANWV